MRRKPKRKTITTRTAARRIYGLMTAIRNLKGQRSVPWAHLPDETRGNWIEITQLYVQLSKERRIID